MSCFPGIHHLMCYFHVTQACQVKLRGKPRKEQKEILHNIDELHSSICPMEYNQLYAVTFRKWCNQCSEFVYYFENQWNSGTAFNQWKVHCCPPGVATTNIPWSLLMPCLRELSQTIPDIQWLLCMASFMIGFLLTFLGNCYTPVRFFIEMQTRQRKCYQSKRNQPRNVPYLHEWYFFMTCEQGQ